MCSTDFHLGAPSSVCFCACVIDIPAGPWTTYSLVSKCGTYGTSTILSENRRLGSLNAFWHAGIHSNLVLTLVSSLWGAAMSKCSGLDFLFFLWSSPSLDVFDLSLVGRHPLFRVYVAKPHDCWFTQLAFLASELNSIVIQPLEACIRILVVLVTFVLYKDVVLDDQYTL